MELPWQQNKWAFESKCQQRRINHTNQHIHGRPAVGANPMTTCTLSYNEIWSEAIWGRENNLNICEPAATRCSHSHLFQDDIPEKKSNKIKKAWQASGSRFLCIGNWCQILDWSPAALLFHDRYNVLTGLFSYSKAHVRRIRAVREMTDMISNQACSEV